MTQEYLVFDTPDAAQVAERVIFNVGVMLAKKAGLVADADRIVGIKGGKPNNAGSGTQAWDTPRQRETDGKWVVTHPKYHRQARDTDLLAELMAEIEQRAGAHRVEKMQPDWFPVRD